MPSTLCLQDHGSLAHIGFLRLACLLVIGGILDEVVLLLLDWHLGFHTLLSHFYRLMQKVLRHHQTLDSSGLISLFAIQHIPFAFWALWHHSCEMETHGLVFASVGPIIDIRLVTSINWTTFQATTLSK